MIDETGKFDRDSTRSLVCGWLTGKNKRDIEADLIELARSCGVEAECPTDYFHARQLQRRADNQPDYDGAIPFLAALTRDQAKNLLGSFREYSFANGIFFEAEMADIGAPSSSKQENYERTLARLMDLISKYFTAHNLAARINIVIHGRNPKLYPLGDGETRATYEARLCTQLDNSNALLDMIEIIPSNASPWKKLASVPADFAAWYCGDQYGIKNPNPAIIRSRDFAQKITAQNPFEQWRYATEDEELTLFAQWLGIGGINIEKAQELLLVADSFVDLRANITTSLEKAQRLYLLIKNRIETNIDEHQNDILPLWIQVQKGLITIENHRGEIAGQGSRKNVVEMLLKFIHHSNVPQDQRELLMDLRLHAFNLEFNGFEFRKILDDFGSESTTILSDPARPYSQDNRMRIAGTIGQAMGFLGKDLLKATSILRSSLAEFAGWVPPTGEEWKKSVFTNMSINYLATTYWEVRDLEQFLKSMELHPEFSGLQTGNANASARLNCMFDRLAPDSLESQEMTLSWHFNLLNLLRGFSICERGMRVEQLEKMIRIIARRGLEMDHPSQLISKWLALHLLKANRAESALECLNNAIDLCFESDLGPTIQATGIPVLAMKLVAQRTLEGMHEVLGRTEALCEVIPGLRRYLDATWPEGWREQWRKDMTEHNLGAIIRWMPWCYA
jgi:hypothetical protein